MRIMHEERTKRARETVSGCDLPHLVVLQGPSLGDLYTLDGEMLVLGSDPFQADVVIRDVEIEPRHAFFYVEEGSEGYELRDLGNGSSIAVNEEVLDAGGNGYRLSNGDRIFLGDSVLEFTSGDPIKASFYDELHRLVNEDHLTGLLTKNRFDDEFEHLLNTARVQDSTLSVIMADIDNLKEINDAHGHLIGEFIVGEVGRIIGEEIKVGGRQATRFGGDEYQILLPRLSKTEALLVARDLQSLLESHTFERDGVTAEPTLSLGVATYPEAGETSEDLTRAADEALYRAKHDGGNAVRA